MARAFFLFFILILIGVGGTLGYRLLGSSLEAEVYRTRLQDLENDHRRLREQYNEAIRKTAVTELQVHEGRLDIVIRTADGQIERTETPFDPQNEIYVDYVVVDGRLWIRRVFDSQTPPRRGLLIDPNFVDVSWDAENAHHGKAVYRALEEGRWVVTVTGGGALGLARQPDGVGTELVSPPALREYQKVSEEVDEALRDIGVAEVLQVLAGALMPAPEEPAWTESVSIWGDDPPQ